MATSKIILRNKIKSNGQFPIALKIRLGKKSKIITLPYSCEKNHWNSEGECFKKNYKNHGILNKALANIKQDAIEIFDLLESKNEGYDLTNFVKEFKSKYYRESNQLEFFHFFEEVINELERMGKYGSARIYKDTRNSFKKFLSVENRRCEGFEDLDYGLLHKYEVFLRANKKTDSDGGISIRMRDLRAIYNRAVNQGHISQSQSPFSKYKISKFKSKKRRIAISVNTLKQIAAKDFSHNAELENAQKIFLFSYSVGGINYTDLANLKWNNVINGRLYYMRSKSKGNFDIKLNESALEILRYFKDSYNDTQYIFPIYFTERHKTDNQKFNRKKKMLSQYNKNLKEISVTLNIADNITSYVARHSFANALRASGQSIDIISQALGHKDVGVTKVYLNEFAVEKMDKLYNSIVL